MSENKPLVYLAVPYSHPDPSVRQWRFERVNLAAAKLMRQGLNIFSPISHTHPISEAGDLPKGWEFWEAFDRAYLTCCNKLIVLKLAGWQESVGVTSEIDIARELGIPVEFIEDEQG
jgi:hypothetical protein